MLPGGLLCGTGSLIIQTDPTANVYIANKPRDTPLPSQRLELVALESLSKPGYQDKSVAVTVQDGQQSIISEELVRLSNTWLISV